MNAFIKFNKGVMKTPIPVRLWLMLLVVVNLVIPLFFLNRLEAQVVAVTFMISVTLMMVLTGLAGFTRLLGLGHVLWLPLLYFLWTRLGQHPADDFFGVWVRVLMALNAVSLVMDAVDVIRYVAGDRAEMVEGL
ncbi:MAG: hypothetical protein O7E52_02405 [Candidatus Poribacteria bacterium]|nr:hypothetical protein [Candidatus Poribacteria bacterium]